MKQIQHDIDQQCVFGVNQMNSEMHEALKCWPTYQIFFLESIFALKHFLNIGWQFVDWDGPAWQFLIPVYVVVR